MKKIFALGLVGVVGLSALLVVGLFFVGDTTLAKKPVPPPPPKGDCLCPDVFSPVICDNGVVYSNLCQAGCAHATGCVPYGDTTVAAAGSCRCPLIYAPVTCDHDRTYSNQCVADCHNAKNCVPSGGI